MARRIDTVIILPCQNGFHTEEWGDGDSCRRGPWFKTIEEAETYYKPFLIAAQGQFLRSEWNKKTNRYEPIEDANFLVSPKIVPCKICHKNSLDSRHNLPYIGPEEFATESRNLSEHLAQTS
jgi:hypothetical protein